MQKTEQKTTTTNERSPDSDAIRGVIQNVAKDHKQETLVTKNHNANTKRVKENI